PSTVDATGIKISTPRKSPLGPAGTLPGVTQGVPPEMDRIHDVHPVAPPLYPRCSLLRCGLMESELPPGTSATKVFEDKTPNAIILNRILLNSLNVAAHDDLEPAEGSELIDQIVLLSRKLLSVWKHLQAYQAHERALAEQAAAWGDTKREYSQDLYEEFD